jgi:hypothetical protein
MSSSSIVKIGFIIIGVFVFWQSQSIAQDIKLEYGIKDGQKVRYKRVVQENQFAELHSSISSRVVKNKEAFLSIEGKDKNDSGLEMTFLQDTVFVNESPPPEKTATTVDIDNILSGIPVQIKMSSTGELQDATALESIVTKKNLASYGFNEKQLAQSAMFLPRLPKLPVSIGQTWSDAQKDTIVPYPSLGKDNSMRIHSSTVTYRAEEMEELLGYTCLKVSWSAESSIEEKHIDGPQERFSEDNILTHGNYYFAPEEQLLIKLEQDVETESTTVFHGKNSGSIPYTNIMKTTITIQR